MDLHERRLGDVEYLKNELLGHRAALSVLISLVNQQQMITEDAYVTEQKKVGYRLPAGWLTGKPPVHSHFTL